MESTGPVSDLGITFGCLYFGLVFTSILWGVGCLQLYLYYEKYWEYDRNWLKIYIFLAWVLDTLHQCLFMDQTYSYFVKAITNPTILGSVTKSSIAIDVVSAFLDGMVHFILIRRVWYISNKNWVITGVLSTFAIALFTITFVLFGYSSRFTELAQFSSITHIEIGMNVLVGVTDTLISVVLIWFLRRIRSGIKRTDSIINRLVLYTVSSGFVTALWAVLALVSAVVAPNSFLYIFADVVIPKLYFNCMLTSLNVRSSLRATPAASGMSVNLSNLAPASGEPSSTSAGSSHKVRNMRALECRVEIDVGRSSDLQLPDRKMANSDADVIHSPQPSPAVSKRALV